MRVLVLGGNGFIGSHLVDALHARGDRVRVFDRRPNCYQAPRPDVDCRLDSFSDSAALAEALQDIDMVYHLISASVPSTSNLDPVADIQGNLVATVRLLQQMVRLNVRRIVYLSSGGTVYGRPTQDPVAETHPLHPICSYGIVKVAVENYLFLFQHLCSIRPVILRPAALFGPRQGHFGVQGAISTFLRRVLEGDSIQVWGDGTVVRDYLYVSDLVALCLLVGDSDETGVFNAGGGKGYSVNELLSLIGRITGRQPAVEYLPGRPFDVEKITLDISRARDVFRWMPTVSIEEGIHRHWNWLVSAPTEARPPIGSD